MEAYTYQDMMAEFSTLKTHELAAIHNTMLVSTKCLHTGNGREYTGLLLRAADETLKARGVRVDAKRLLKEKK
jgi:hypothetical protein